MIHAIRLQVAGIAAVTLTDANHLPVYALLATFLASVIKQFFDANALKRKWKQDHDDAEQRRKWLVEDRKEANAHAENVTAKLAENTELTRAGVTAAHEAYSEANNLNRKLERLGIATDSEDGKLVIFDKIVTNFPPEPEDKP